MAEKLIWKANIFSTERKNYEDLGYVLGEPQATDELPLESLKQHGMVGIYVKEGGVDPNMHHGEIYVVGDGPEAE